MQSFTHMFDFTFEVANQPEDGEKITGSDIREALLKRVNSLSDEELVSTLGGPRDTYTILKMKFQNYLSFPEGDLMP